jgi:hypothetical protein
MGDKSLHMIPGEYYEISYSHSSTYTLLCVEYEGGNRYQVQTYTMDGFRKELDGTVNLSKLGTCKRITKPYAMTLTNPTTNDEALSLLIRESIV